MEKVLMPRRRAILKILLAAALTLAVAPPAHAAEGAAATLMSLINAYRAASSRPALTADDTLSAVARRHGEDMARRAYFSHVTPEGGSFGDRLWNAGYTYAVAAENLARGYRDAAAVLAGWQGSPGHLANLLRADVSRAGIGVVEPPPGAPTDSSRGPVWVLVLAAPRDAGR
jgi:uncharacterized protein YkwD